MTPRYEYTWDGGQFFLAASIRAYCYANCYCNSVGKARTSRSQFTSWQFLQNHQLVIHGDGSIDYGKRGPGSTGIFKKLATVLPPQNGAGGPTSGTCGADGKQFCPAPWPLAEFGPIPRAPPYSTDIVRPPTSGADATNDLTVCGNRCSGQSDCKAGVDNYSCDCAYPNSEDAQTLGLDPVAPPSICLSLASVNFGLSTLSTLLTPRGEETLRDVGEQRAPYQCRCNATYTGNECCGSSDGMVWLE